MLLLGVKSKLYVYVFSYFVMLLLGVKLFVFSRDIGNCRLALKNSGAREVGSDVIGIHLWDGRYWLLWLHDCRLCNL